MCLSKSYKVVQLREKGNPITPKSSKISYLNRICLALIILTAYRSQVLFDVSVLTEHDRHGYFGNLLLHILKAPSYLTNRLNLSTEEMYRSDHMKFFGNYSNIRSKLDYNYHSNFNEERQLFQNSLIDKIIFDHLSNRNGKVTSAPWIVFTAGAMGAGKSHSIRALHEARHFPLDSFVLVDPDEIRRMLPEFELYLDYNPTLAGEKTRKEAGLIAEILTNAALNLGLNVLVDGSLRDAHWYEHYFAILRKSYSHKGLKIGILHITAPREAIFERAKMRSKLTRRVVPRETLEETLEKVPWSIEILAPLADFFAELHNSPHEDGIQLIKMFHKKTIGTGWIAFQDVWNQKSNTTKSNNNWIEEQIEYQMIRWMSKL